jgi:hypothetical protein
MNIVTVNMENLINKIKFSIKMRISSVKKKSAINTPIFIWGKPGIGKTESLANFCKENGYQLFDLILSQLDPTDLRGLPIVIDGNADFATYKSVLPDSTDKSIGILFLDEFPQAADIVQSAAYKLIHERKIGSYTLPINYIIVAAGNREEDGGTYYEIGGALKDRFAHVYLEPDYNSFITLMEKRYKTINGSEDLISYFKYAVHIKEHTKIYDYKPELLNFPTFRSWEKVFIEIQYGNNVLDAIHNNVGEFLSIDFKNFLTLVQNVPEATKLIAEKIYFSDIAKQIIACQKVTGKILSDKNKDKIWESFSYFIDMKNPENSADNRQELTILSLVEFKNKFEILSAIADEYKNKNGGKDFYNMIFKKYKILYEL